MDLKQPAPSSSSLPVDLGAVQEQVLEALRHEHLAFAEALRRISSRFGAGSTPVSSALIGQVRLTQQFLDAQRSLLRRTAEIEAVAASIVAAAISDAEQMVEGAALHLRRSGREVPCSGAPVLLEGQGRPEALDVRALQCNLRDRQDELISLVESWWSAEHEWGTAFIDRAHATAAHIRQHAEVEVQRLVGSATEDRSARSSCTAATSRLSVASGEDLLALLDPSDPNLLDQVLDGLLGDVLQPSPHQSDSALERASMLNGESARAAGGLSSTRPAGGPQDLVVWGAAVEVRAPFPSLTRVFIPLAVSLTVLAGLVAWSG